MGFHAVDGDLHLVAGAIVAYPYHPKACLLLSVKDADNIAGPEIGIEARKHGPAEADITSLGFQQKPFSLGVDTPDQDLKVGSPARFTAAVKCTKDSHGGSLTVALPGKWVKVTQQGNPL